MDSKTLYDYYNKSTEQYFNLHQSSLKFFQNQTIYIKRKDNAASI